MKGIWRAVCDILDLGGVDKDCFGDDEIREVDIRIRRDKKGNMSRHAKIKDAENREYEISTF